MLDACLTVDYSPRCSRTAFLGNDVFGGMGIVTYIRISDSSRIVPRLFPRPYSPMGTLSAQKAKYVRLVSGAPSL